MKTPRNPRPLTERVLDLRLVSVDRMTRFNAKGEKTEGAVYMQSVLLGLDRERQPQIALQLWSSLS